MCVDSCAAFYLFEREREQGLGRKRAVRLSRTALSGVGASELEAQAKLHAPREMRVSGMKKRGCCDAPGVAGGVVCTTGAVHCHAAASSRTANLVELRMVEKVEVLPAEIDCFILAEGKALEEAEVEIQAARQVKGVASHIAEGESRGQGECSRVIEKRASNSGNVGLRKTGMRVANQIRTGACSHAIGHTSVIAKVCAVRNAERLAGLGDGDA